MAGVCGNAVTKYLKMYRQGGLDEVKRVNFYQPKSELENHRDTIEPYFRDNPITSIAEAVVSKIEALTGIRRSKNQVSEFLKKIGMRFRKVETIPGAAGPDVRAHFKKNFGPSNSGNQSRKTLHLHANPR